MNVEHCLLTQQIMTNDIFSGINRKTYSLSKLNHGLLQDSVCQSAIEYLTFFAMNNRIYPCTV